MRSRDPGYAFCDPDRGDRYLQWPELAPVMLGSSQKTVSPGSSSRNALHTRTRRSLVILCPSWTRPRVLLRKCSSFFSFADREPGLSRHDSVDVSITSSISLIYTNRSGRRWARRESLEVFLFFFFIGVPQRGGTRRSPLFYAKHDPPWKPMVNAPKRPIAIDVFKFDTPGVSRA